MINAPDRNLNKMQFLDKGDNNYLGTKEATLSPSSLPDSPSESRLHGPASSLKLSRAPRPVSLTFPSDFSKIAFARSTAFSEGTDISNPSSPMLKNWGSKRTLRTFTSSTASVNNQVYVIICHLSDHRVINRSTFLIRENSQSPGSRSQPSDISYHKLFKERYAILSLEAQPTHVRHIKQTSISPAIHCRVHDGILVLNWHAPSSERDHLCTILDMEVIENRLLEISF
ncbi:hypothetical protein AKJ16_DCAP10226 [Drosera capensis]